MGAPTTITVKGTDAINVNDIANGGGNVPHVTLSKGTYAVTLKSDINFHDQTMPLNQVIIFNCAPLQSGNAEGWYEVADGTKTIYIEAEDNEPIYVAVLDQVTTSDNTGSATVTFTPDDSSGCKSGTQKIHLSTSFKVVMVSAIIQSSALQTFKLTDSEGKVIIDWEGSSPSDGRMVPLGKGSTSFQPSGTGDYTVELTPNSGILSGVNKLKKGNETYVETITFATNDGGCDAGDKDFNDTIVQFVGIRNLG